MKYSRHILVVSLLIAVLVLPACDMVTGTQTEIPGGIDPEARTVGEYTYTLKTPVSEVGLKELQSAVDGILSPVPLPKSLQGDYKVQRVIPRESGIIAKGVKVSEINIVLSDSEIEGELDPNAFNRITTDSPDLWPDIFNTIGHRSIVLTLFHWKGYPVPSSYYYDCFLPAPEDNYLPEYLGLKTGGTEKVGDADVYTMSYGDTIWVEWRLPDWDAPQFIVRAMPGKEVSPEDFRKVIASIELPEPELLLPYAAGVYASDRLFPDPNLESYILDTFPNIVGPVKPEDVNNIEEIRAHGRNIVSLAGLEHCTNLKVLDLEDNHISNLSPLAGLAKLAEVNLTGNEITDVTPLAKLNNLENLKMGYNHIVDVSPLVSLIGLDYLDLGWNEIEDISSLSRLTRLAHLDIGVNNIEDIRALSGLNNLSYLYLNHNRVQDVSPLSGLSQIESLYLSDNQIEDVSSLFGLTQLRSLGLYHNRIKNITALAGLEQLEYLDLRVNRISDLTPFAGASLPELKRLDLNYNLITDASPLTEVELPKLEIITIEGNKLSAKEISEFKDALKPKKSPDTVFPEVAVYAEHYGITANEALRRFEIQDAFAGLGTELSIKEPGTFAGLYIQHEPEFRIVALFTREGEEIVEPYIPEGLAEYVEVRTVEVSYLELQNAQSEVSSALGRLGIPADSGIYVMDNNVECRVTDMAIIDKAISDGSLTVPDCVVFTEVEGLARPD